MVPLSAFISNCRGTVVFFNKLILFVKNEKIKKKTSKITSLLVET